MEFIKKNGVFFLALLAFLALGYSRGRGHQEKMDDLVFVQSQEKTFDQVDGTWGLWKGQESIEFSEDKISFYMDDKIRDHSLRKADLKVYRAEEAKKAYEKNVGDFPQARMDQALKDYKIGWEDFYLLEVENQYLLDKNKKKTTIDDKNYYLVINAQLIVDETREEVILFVDDLSQKTGLFIKK